MSKRKKPILGRPYDLEAFGKMWSNPNWPCKCGHISGIHATRWQIDLENKDSWGFAPCSSCFNSKNHMSGNCKGFEAMNNLEYVTWCNENKKRN